MKKLSNSSSYSPPSSSSSTTSLDPTMCHSKSSTEGCFSAILRRILCSGGLPTHPSDQIREVDSNSIVSSSKDQNFKAKHHTKATTTASTSSSTCASSTTSTTTPGIVARLMGLDSMVEVPSNSLSRSRSMNSVDCLGECNRMDGLHKRVKSTLSFREVPTFLLLENDNFLVLSFENGGERKGSKSIGSKREMGSAELKQRERREKGELKENKREKAHGEKASVEKGKMSKMVCDVSCGSVENGGKLKEITNISFSSPKSKASREKKKCFDSEARKLSQPKKYKEVVVGEKMKRRRKKKTNCCNEKKSEIECKSEDTSPVSVLDFEKREASGTVGLSSRRKLSPELENDQQVLLRSDGNLMVEEGKVKAIENNNCEGSKKKEKHNKEYIDIWGEVCRLVEDELVGSNQIHAWMNKQDDDLGSISADFESEIFDQLLNELIDQLVVGHPIATLQLQKL